MGSNYMHNDQPEAIKQLPATVVSRSEHRYLGVGLTILSAILFGVSPVFTAYVYQLGGTPETVTFFRSLFAALILLPIIWVKKIPLALPWPILSWIMVLGIISGITTLLLYLSYPYVGIGTATTLHFLYPMFVCLIGWVAFKERLAARKVWALVLSGVGVACFVNINEIKQLTGLVIAAISGLTYALYMVGIEQQKIDRLNSWLITFYVAVAVAGFMAVYNLAVSKIVVILPGAAYGYMIVIALLTSLFAVLLLQLGIRYLGASTAAIFCLFEPVASIVCGYLFLGEPLTVAKIMGCLLVSSAVILLVTNNNELVQPKPPV